MLKKGRLVGGAIGAKGKLQIGWHTNVDIFLTLKKYLIYPIWVMPLTCSIDKTEPVLRRRERDDS